MLKLKLLLIFIQSAVISSESEDENSVSKKSPEKSNNEKYFSRFYF